MDALALLELRYVFVLAGVFGALGGLVWFLYALSGGHYRNDRYKVKATIEIAGGTCVAAAGAPFISTIIKHRAGFVLVAFAMGLCWSQLVQVFRAWITRVVRATLGNDQD